MTRCFFCRGDKEDTSDLRCTECKAKDEKGELDRTMSISIKGTPQMYSSYEKQNEYFRSKMK